MVSTEEVSEVSKFFSNSNIFLTGGSGVVGKVTISKLLLECKPSMIYLLIRGKKSKTPLQRLDILFNDPIFSLLKKKLPDYKNYITVIEGDCTEFNLGLSSQSEKILLENIDVVIHSAASVRFSESMKSSLYSNVKGTKETLNLAQKMVKLKIFVYVSSISTNIERICFEEKIYDLPFHYDDLLSLAKIDHILPMDDYKHKFIGDKSVEYTFTKALAEQIFLYTKTNFPIVIYRCPGVIGCWKEPLPGWIGNLNAGIGVIVLVLFKIQSNFYLPPIDPRFDLVPADFTTNALLAFTEFSYKKFQEPKEEEGKEIMPYVFNYSIRKYNSLPILGLLDDFSKRNETPIYLHSSKILYFIIRSLFYYIPAYFIDLLFPLLDSSGEFGLLKVHQYCDALIGIAEKLQRDYQPSDENVQECWQKLNSTDKRIYQFHPNLIDWNDYVPILYEGIMSYESQQPLHFEYLRRLKFWLPKIRLLAFVVYCAIGIFIVFKLFF